MDLDSAFGHWLAGFIDGEGCFLLYRNHGSWDCRFELALRDDDADILHEVYQRIGLGRIAAKPAYRTSKPQVTWQIKKQEECVGLIEVLDRFPLRAKKQRDYAIWREAVFAKVGKKYEGLEALSTALKSGRDYQVSAR